MSSDSQKKCFISECKGDTIVVCCCNELFMCQDHFDDHHRSCDSKLYSIPKYFEAMQSKNENQVVAKETMRILKLEIISRTEALVTFIHTESALMLEKLNKIFKYTQPSQESIEFEIDSEFASLFEKLEICQQAQSKSYSKTKKTEAQSKSQLHSLFSPEVLRQNYQKPNSSFSKHSTSPAHDSDNKKETSQDWKFNEDLDRLKLNLIKEQSEVIALKRNLEEREEALNTRRTQLYNLEMHLLAKQMELNTALEELFRGSNIELKKKIAYMSGFIDWRVRDATGLTKTNDKRFLFNCKLYLDCIVH